jgi:hypothetical protein
VVGSLLSVVLALVGLGIARSAARETRENRDFQLDRSVADDFASTVDALYADYERGRSDIAVMSMGFRAAVTAWAGRATSTGLQVSRGEVPGFLIQLERDAQRPLRAREGVDAAARWRYLGVLTQAKRLTRAWSYPERRRDVLREILLERAEASPYPRHSPRVQMQRWMLVSDPSPRRAIHAARQLGVFLAILSDDVRAKRLRRTIGEWWVYTRRAREERQAFRQAQRRARLRLPAGATADVNAQTGSDDKHEPPSAEAGGILTT